MRASFFGPEASTSRMTASLLARHPDAFTTLEIDIRDRTALERLFAERAREIELVIHTAAQPSHDWAASDPHTDFAVNALGTLNLLEAARAHAPGATFVFCSTNKVYGDLPNALPLLELPTRLDLPEDHPYHEGIDTSMSIDRSTHSLFGVSKTAADLLVQEYGRYFDMPTVCFRAGCLTGPNHAGARLHGFLVLPDALHRHRRALHRARLRRQAGARQHPLRRPHRRVRGLPSRSPRRRRRLQHRRRARVQLLDARGHRPLSAHRRARAALDARRAPADRRSPLVDQRPAPVHGRLSPTGRSRAGWRTSCARFTTQTRSAGWRGSELDREGGGCTRADIELGCPQPGWRRFTLDGHRGESCSQALDRGLAHRPCAQELSRVSLVRTLDVHAHLPSGCHRHEHQLARVRQVEAQVRAPSSCSRRSPAPACRVLPARTATRADRRPGSGRAARAGPRASAPTAPGCALARSARRACAPARRAVPAAVVWRRAQVHAPHIDHARDRAYAPAMARAWQTNRHVANPRRACASAPTATRSPRPSTRSWRTPRWSRSR